MISLPAIQRAIEEAGYDGWLLCDFHGSNAIARRVLQFPAEKMTTRRWFYYIPAAGAPQKLVHRIEPAVLDHLPGDKEIYLRWQELEAGIARLVTGRNVAMEYSAKNAIPYIAKVDAGTVELVRSYGATVASSGDLVQMFEATLDDAQWQMHLEAARHTDAAYGVAWQLIASRVRGGGEVRESEVQQRILAYFAEHRLLTDHPPIVAVGPHSGDPHYTVTAATDAPIRESDFVLIDLWAKLAEERAVYSDLTRVGYVGREVPDEYERIFQIVAAARDAAIARVREAFAAGTRLEGWEVDRAARRVIDAAGYGDQFVHRTGHNIGQELHGAGAHMDDLETHESRAVLPRTCFSIEPGIYLDRFGVRSEVNVFVDANSGVHVTGGPVQERVLPILREPDERS